MDPILTDPMDSYTNAYAAYNQEVSLFDFGEVIVMKNYKQNDHVRIVSGGSCCHIKYVGTGILTASIQGNKNDPPTSSLILRTIRELSINHIKGVLLIIQATSGDLLSFGLAVERADNDDLRVAFIKVADDSRNNEYPKSERRGLSGVVLVNKIAGALAMANKTMPDIYDYCIKVVDNLASIGTNVKNLLIDSRECMYCDKCAMQLEGAEKKTFLNKLTTMDILDNTVRTLIKEISENESLNLKPKDNIVVLVNNLDALNQNEEWVFFRHCVKYLNIIDLVVVKFYIGNFLQFNYDLDLTITILKVFDKNVIELLDAPCDVKVWKPVLQNKPIEISNNLIPGSLRRKCRLSLPIKGPKLNDRAANVVLLCLQFACEALISCEKMLNTMDAEKGSLYKAYGIKD
ncbi:hypothetical protein ABEB36_008567 [Hypothenemus hampei]|uniref:DhaK domain-containing protein n=1 Tax=Hypothenemus hampei TaxID=57062 RepID=A0ABD1EMB8_HYPHA